MSLLYEKESYAIIGACFEVYKQKGCGFVEQVYQECLKIEFDISNVPNVAQPELQLDYKGRDLEVKYRPDFVCFEKIIVELKAHADLCDAHRAQLHNYLKSTGLRLGLLVNFGHHPKLEYERIVH